MGMIVVTVFQTGSLALAHFIVIVAVGLQVFFQCLGNGDTESRYTPYRPPYGQQCTDPTISRLP